MHPARRLPESMAPLGGDFSAKVAQANDRIICGSSVDAVKTVPMGRILARRLRIPFFQRRYCWSEPQWATLLRDVEACGGAGHALGRLTCAVEADGRLLVIDGQQRSTTCALLLAAVRDAPAADGALRARINNVLFPDGAALARWRASRGAAAVICDGEALDFAAVVPTHCDRAAFYEAVLPRGARAANSAWRRPAEAKAYFLDALRALRARALRLLPGLDLADLELDVVLEPGLPLAEPRRGLAQPVAVVAARDHFQKLVEVELAVAVGVGLAHELAHGLDVRLDADELDEVEELGRVDRALALVVHRPERVLVEPRADRAREDVVGHARAVVGPRVVEGLEPQGHGVP